MLSCAINVISFIRKAILPIENEIYPQDSDEAFEGHTEVVIKSMYDVQKNIFSIAKNNISVSLQE